MPSNGGQSWISNTWVTLATRCWDIGNHTYFSLWVYNQTNWKQLVTIDYPYPSARFNYGATSFLENYGGTTPSSLRKMRTRNGWKRYTNSVWGYFNTGYFDVGVPGVQGGAVGDYFFMTTKSGLSASPTKSEQLVTNPTISRPVYPPARISSWTARYQDNRKSLTISWVIDSSRSPQLIYTVKLFYASNNSLAKLIQDSAAHLRNVVINIGGLGRGKYHIQLSIQDIFDQISPIVNSSFFLTGNSTVFPSPVPSSIPSLFPTQLISAMFTNFASLKDISGKPIAATSSFRVPRLFDWNRDGRLDLLVGSGGFLWLYLNNGSSTSPIFKSGVKISSNNSSPISLGNSKSTFALADMDGDGLTDLVVADSQKRLQVFQNIGTATSSLIYSTSYLVQDSTTGLAFLLADQRFDIGDWNGDGLPDLVVGSYCGDVHLYLNTNSLKRIKLGPAQVLLSDCYNWYPRLFDINRNGVVDLIRGINWGDITYWLDPAHLGMISSDQFIVTNGTGTVEEVRWVTDGAIVDFGDLNGDGYADLVFGGHNNGNNLFVAYSTKQPSQQPSTHPPIVASSRPSSTSPSVRSTLRSSVVPTPRPTSIPTVRPNITTSRKSSPSPSISSLLKV